MPSVLQVASHASFLVDFFDGLGGVSRSQTTERISCYFSNRRTGQKSTRRVASRVFFAWPQPPIFYIHARPLATMGQYEKDKKELQEKIEQLEHKLKKAKQAGDQADVCLLYTSPSPRDRG